MMYTREELIQSCLRYKTGDHITTILDDLDEAFRLKQRSDHQKKEAIFKTCNQIYGYTVEELKGKNRRAGLVNARRFLVYFLDRETGFTLEQKGKFINRDHATALHHQRKVKDWVNINDKQIMREIKAFEFNYRNLLNGSTTSNEVQN